MILFLFALTFMSNSCSIFQFSTHFMLSKSAFLISEDEVEDELSIGWLFMMTVVVVIVLA